jgi:hypothetical protein
VPKEQLDAAQVNTCFEQMRREAMPLMPRAALTASD